MSFNTTVAIHTIGFFNLSYMFHISNVSVGVHSFFICSRFLIIFMVSIFFIIVIFSYSSYFPFDPTVPFNTTVAIHTIVFLNLFHIYGLPPLPLTSAFGFMFYEE